METRKAILNRRSRRWFSDKPVDKESLRGIVRDAQFTPSWANSQPWKVWIATGNSLEKIRQKHLARVLSGQSGHADLSVMSREEWDIAPRQNMRQWSQEFIGHEGQGGREFANFQAHLFNAPALVYLTIPKKSAAWSIYDLGAFSQTLMLSAFDRGVESLVAYEIIKFPDDIREVLGIPEDQMIVMGIALGYEADENLNDFVSSRVSLDEMLVIEN